MYFCSNNEDTHELRENNKKNSKLLKIMKIHWDITFLRKCEKNISFETTNILTTREKK